MFPTKISQLLIAVTIVSAVGCSGSRLRNMITRSDYKSLEQIEAQDSVKEAREAADREKAIAAGKAGTEANTKLVAQQKEATADADAEEPKKRNRLSLAGLLNRDVEEDKISPDPFLVANREENATPDKPAIAATGSSIGDKTIQQTASKTTTTSADQAEQYVTNSTEPANTAAEMFRDIAATDAAVKTAANDKPATANAVTTAEESFADFIAAQAKKSKSEFEQKVAEAAQPVTQKETAIQEAEALAANPTEPVSAFDDLLSSTESPRDTAAGKQAANGEPSDDLVPGLDELLAETSGSAFPEDAVTTEKSADTAKSPSFESVFGTGNPAVADSESATASTNPFATEEATNSTAEPLAEDDPWAAFRNNQQAVAAVTSTKNGFAAGEKPQPQPFNWADSSNTGRTEESKSDSPFSNATATDSSTTVEKSPFTTASASTVMTDPANQTSTAGLVIPPVATQQVSFASSDDANRGTAFDDSQTDPFTTGGATSAGDDLFAHADDELFAAAAADIATEATVATDSATFQGWSTRTWFFLLGCIIVALVLFMPERHKQTNP